MPGVGEGGATPEVAAPTVTPAEARVQGLVNQAKVAEASKTAAVKKAPETAVDKPKLPQKVLASKEFQDYRTGVEKTEGKKLSDEEAIDSFYQKQAFEMVGKGISNEVQNDPLFKQQVAQIRLEAQRDGKTLTPGEVELEASKRFLKIQDQRVEGIKPEQNLSSEERITLLEGQIEKIQGDNQEMKEMLKQILIHLEKQAKTGEEKEKWYQLLLKLAAITGVEVVSQATGRVIPREH